MDKNGLALESAGILTKKDGARCASRKIGGVKVTDIRLSNDAARRIGRREGRYITLHGEPHTEGMTALLRRALMQILPPRGRLFAAGLGNPDITQDSLGAASVRGLTARRGAKYSLAAIETDVAARTGLETARLVKAASKELRADCVIAIDALSAFHRQNCAGKQCGYNSRFGRGFACRGTLRGAARLSDCRRRRSYDNSAVRAHSPSRRQRYADFPVRRRYSY